MFRFEKDMIPILEASLSKLYKTEYLTTEFNTGNGIADLVFTTKMNDETLIFDDYSLMSIFIKHFNKKEKLNRDKLFKKCSDKKKLNKLLKILQDEKYISVGEDYFIQKKKYKTHTKNLISVEAKLNDWKSGTHQALRYQFFSNKTFLAYPENIINRVDVNLLKHYNIGLISVKKDGINVLLNPKGKKPEDILSYSFLSQTFAQKFKLNLHMKLSQL
jgi:hypothetical protein